MNLSQYDATVAAPVVISLPKTSEQVQAELKNPNSRLSQDLFNAFMDALLRKEAHRRMEIRYAIDQAQRRKIDEVEDELAKRREQTKAAQDQNWEEYYAEQGKIARASLELLARSSLPDFYQSFPTKIQELVLVQTQLRELHRERELLLEQKQEIRRACIDDFRSALDSGRVYTMDDGQQISLGISHLPKDVQQDMKEDEFERLDRMTSRPSKDVVVANYDKYGAGKRSMEDAFLDEIQLMYMLRIRAKANAPDSTSIIKLVSGRIMEDYDPILTGFRKDNLRLTALLGSNAGRASALEKVEISLLTDLGLSSPAMVVHVAAMR